MRCDSFLFIGNVWQRWQALGCPLPASENLETETTWANNALRSPQDLRVRNESVQKEG